jgi:sarcosine oxidase, subunit beta
MTRPGRTFDVAVIGGGVMGASAGFQLARAGLKVGILERGAFGQEASGANAGTLSVQNKPLDSVPAVLASLELWGALSDELGIDAAYERRGGFRICQGEEEWATLEKQFAAQQKCGLPGELVAEADLHRELPFLGSSVLGASYCPLDGMANPFATVNGFLARAAEFGAELMPDCSVEGIEARTGLPFELTTTGGRLEAAHIVAAAGVWNRDLAAMVGVDLPIRVLVQQALITTPMRDIFPQILTHVQGNLTLKQQRVSGKVQIGGGWPGDSDSDVRRSSVRFDSLVGNLRHAARVVPALASAHLLRAWTGFEGRTPDKLLLAGPVGPEGFFVVGCQSGGFTMSPLAGEIIADYILTRTSRVSTTGFLPGRFAGVVP